ncbi:MAG: PaaI family thioesterase [Proteobacteria bacterium]|nr:MAG: PaaI family thioesterase [Pseudomonadota bacterium]
MSVHESFLSAMSKFQSSNPNLELPPKSFTEMKGEVVEFHPNGQLSVEFPFDPRFTNPMGVFQGGMLGTAVDNVFGPLSYFVAQGPCVTLDMHLRFTKPFLSRDESILVRAEVKSHTSRMLVMDASVHSKQGELIALATTQFMKLDGQLVKPLR